MHLQVGLADFLPLPVMPIITDIHHVAEFVPLQGRRRWSSSTMARWV
jgi:hypothetical protein